MLRGPHAGAVLACAHCGSPVSVPAAEARPEPKSAQASAPVAPKWEVPWVRVAWVLTGLLIAHVGLHLLLTRDARAGSTALRGRWGNALDAAPAPGPMPEPKNPDYAAWDTAKARHDAAQELARHDRHRSLLASGLAFSFLVQVGITLWVVWRFGASTRRKAPAPGRRTGGRAQ